MAAADGRAALTPLNKNSTCLDWLDATVQQRIDRVRSVFYEMGVTEASKMAEYVATLGEASGDTKAKLNADYLGRLVPPTGL